MSGIQLGQFQWDDMQGAVISAKTGAAAPSWTTWNYGIDGGVDFAAQSWGINDYVTLFYQMPHGAKLFTKAEQHIHWSCDTNDAGKKIKFRFDIIGASINGTWAAVSGSPFTAEYTMVGTEANKHNYMDITEIVKALNSNVSSIFVSKLTRIAASSDDYTDTLYIIYADAHILKDSNGSRFESSK